MRLLGAAQQAHALVPLHRMIIKTLSWGTSLSNSKETKEHPIRCANLIIPRLYLSDLSTAQNATAIEQLGITHIISVIETAPPFPEAMAHIQKLHIQASDTPTDNLLPHLQTTTAFIQAALDQSPDAKVLVHCLQGISRSVTVVSAYLIATTNMIAFEAIDFVRSKRSIACPNLAFRRQLEQYATSFYSGGRKGALERNKLGSSVAERIKRLKQKTKKPT